MANVVTRVEGRSAGVTGSIYSFLFPVPVICFVGALVTDIVYVSSAFLMWLHFSQWLIAAGIAFGIIAGIALLVELIASRAIRAAPMGWVHVVLFYAGLVVAIFNAFVHTADGWTAVMPAGMILSIVAAVLMLAAAGTLPRLAVRSVEVRRL
jgi:uncharacterized membrane protein